MISQKKIFRICSVIMALSGITILFSTLYPIFSYEWEASQKYPLLISPLVEEETGSFKFSKTNYTDPNIWFEDEKKQGESVSENDVNFYTLSIPKLRIDNAKVIISGNDLSRSLIQYQGTSVPGRIGNAVIFGHSILPQFYDPKNYLAIFSLLPSLEKGDEIFVYYDGLSIKYEVADMFEVRPKDIQILEQNSSGSYLTLVTCTPPGHPLKPKRLIVRAKLVPNDAVGVN